jgi:hypothetical protein
MSRSDRGEGMDINENAPVITRDEIVIQAPTEPIWEIQAEQRSGAQGAVSRFPY